MVYTHEHLYLFVLKLPLSNVKQYSLVKQVLLNKFLFTTFICYIALCILILVPFGFSLVRLRGAGLLFCSPIATTWSSFYFYDCVSKENLLGKRISKEEKQEKYLNFPMTIPNAITNICIEKVFFNTKVKRKDELNTQSLGLFNYLKSAQTHHREGNATHSSTLAWKIPWTEEPGGLQSMGSQRVRHD